MKCLTKALAWQGRSTYVALHSSSIGRGAALKVQIDRHLAQRSRSPYRGADRPAPMQPANSGLISDLPRVTEGLLSAGLAYRDLGGVAAGAETADRKASSFSVMVAICSDSFFVSAF